MNRDERLEAIMELIRVNGKVQSSELKSKFMVTDMTIRRDLDYLVSEGRIIRTHGGAVGAENASKSEVVTERSYNIRIQEHLDRKISIAKTAIQLLEPHQYVFLDSGTSTLVIGKSIEAAPDEYAFITNGVNIAAELLSRQFTRVILLGGEIDQNTWSTRGTLTERQLNDFHADIAFLGCNAISPQGEVMIGNTAETSLKRRIMAISNKKYVLADTAKFNHFSLISYAAVDEFDGIITDGNLDETIAASLIERGAKIL